MVILQVEAIGDDVARIRPLRCLVAQPQVTKVFERCLQLFSYRGGNHGHDLLGKTVPSAYNNPLHRLHLARLLQCGWKGIVMWMEWDQSR
jgi:hypothetical protein